MNIVVYEANYPLPVSSESDFLSLLEDNPLAPFTAMDIGVSLTWRPYDRRTAVNALKDDPDNPLLLNAEVPYPVQGGVGRAPYVGRLEFNNASLGADQRYLAQPHMPQRIIAYLNQWRTEFRNFSKASADADDRDNDFWMDIAKIESSLPDCFPTYRLDWYTIISARTYGDYFKREDLLATPAFRVEELDDGCIAIQSYEHPLAFADESVTRDIITITTYLNQRRLD
jgi:hypothetical protein